MGVDLALSERGGTVIEVNPRYTASVEVAERAAGRSALAAHVAAFLRSEFTQQQKFHGDPPSMTYAKAIVFAARRTTISWSWFEWAIAQSSLDPNECALSDIPTAGQTIEKGRPVLTVFAAGSSQDECQRQLAERVAEVEVRLYGGR